VVVDFCVIEARTSAALPAHERTDGLCTLARRLALVRNADSNRAIEP